MTIEAEAWFIYAADEKEWEEKAPANLVRERFTLTRPQGTEILAAPIYGCWEGNMGHALKRRPIDVCLARKEERVVLGNAGVVEVLEVGEDVKSVRPGQLGVIFCNSEPDWFGYPHRIFGYDARGTMGCLSTRMKLHEGQLVPLPKRNKHALEKWAGFSLRYVTAWSNWQMAHGAYRLSVGEDELAAINVWGWGGGVTLAELDLARRFGCHAVMLSGSESRLKLIEEMGITALDRRKYGDLNYDPERYRQDTDYAVRYKKAEEAMLADVVRMTDGRKVQIFIDMIGGPVFRATLRALSREGVVATAGWREGMTLTINRAMECIERHQHVHTHYARFSQGWKAVAFADGNGWLPPAPEKIWTFDEIPKLAEAYNRNETEIFPVFSVNPR